MGSTFVFSLAGIPGNKLVVVCSVYKRLGKKKRQLISSMNFVLLFANISLINLSL